MSTAPLCCGHAKWFLPDRMMLLLEAQSNTWQLWCVRRHLPLPWGLHASLRYCWRHSATWRRKWARSIPKAWTEPRISLMHRGVLVLKTKRHSYKNRQLTDLLWSKWSQQMATDFPQRPWAWGMSLHRLCHLQSHQNCWCLCHCWALGPQGQPLPKQWETARKEQVWTAAEKKEVLSNQKFQPNK